MNLEDESVNIDVIRLPEETHFWQPYEDCLGSSLNHIYNYCKTILLYILLFRMFSNLAKRDGRFRYSVHLASIICGTLVLASVIGLSVLYCMLFVYCNTCLFIILTKWRVAHGKTGYWMGTLCLSLLTTCEILDWNPDVWSRIRGVLMIATMKIVSLAFDFDASVINNKREGVDLHVGTLSCLGYLFCPANCLLGPWTSFSDYMSIVNGTNFLGTKDLIYGTLNLVISIVFLLTSNCFISDSMLDFTSKWPAAYRDAFSFRSSHYFVSFLSQSSMIIGGYCYHANSLYHSKIFGYRVVNPIAMEFPRSLTDVVINWNIPVHYWLKNYVFRIVRRKSVTLAIFLTYLVSALLHGMNTKLAAVLLSLGLFSSVEHKFRLNMSEYLDACVRASACKNCDHKFKRFSPITLITNACFSAITVIHLAFLGSNIYTSASSIDENSIEVTTWMKWSELNFISFWICFGLWFYDYFLKY